MAEHKKSFILYADLLHTVSKMPIEKAGELFLHILKYVNDENPETNDMIIELTFEPIKQSLKRDLVKWSSERSKRSESGHIGGVKSGEIRRKLALLKQNEANEASALKTKQTKQTQANEAVSVSVSVSDNEIQEQPSIAFSQFWEAYDKKKGDKDRCNKKWDKLDFNTQQKIINFLPEWMKQFSDKQFQPFAETFLNQKRWNDELSPSANHTKSKHFH